MVKKTHIVQARESDLTTIEKLWTETFQGVDDEHIQYLKSEFIPNSQIMLLKDENSEILSSFVLTPINLYFPTEGRVYTRENSVDGKSLSDVSRRFKTASGYYISYVVTPRNFRGRGYFVQLLKGCENLFISQDFIALRPSTHSLIPFYHRLGFNKMFCCEEYILSGSNYDFVKKSAATKLSQPNFSSCLSTNPLSTKSLSSNPPSPNSLSPILSITDKHNIVFSTVNLSQVSLEDLKSEKVRAYRLPQNFPLVQAKFYKPISLFGSHFAPLFIDGGF